MKATFKPKEGNKDRWEIWLDENKWREVHRVIFGRKPTFPALSSEEEIQTVFDAYEYRRVKGYVLWRLSSQSYHSEQLAKLLRERLVQSQTIERVLQEYKDMGVLNDEAWLQSFLHCHQKRYGLRFILSKLQSKGLSSDTLQPLAKEWQNPQEEIQAIQHLLETRYRNKNLSQYKEKQKVIAALLRKGYPYEQVKVAVQHFCSDESV